MVIVANNQAYYGKLQNLMIRVMMIDAVAFIFFIDKDGPVQVVIREGKRYLLGGLHRAVPQDRQGCGHQVHEEEVR